MHWVTMWGNAQSMVLPQPAVYAKDITLRYPIFVPFGGTKIRITLDNFCGKEKVTIEEIYISKGSTLSNEAITDGIPLTKNSKRQFEIEAQESITSDSIDFLVEENEYLIISIYLKNYTNLTSGVDIVGPLSKGYFAYGNQALNKKLDIRSSKTTSWVYFLANVDIYTEDENEAILCYGDSITSQDWPDYFLLSLREQGIKNRSVIRKAVSGTRVLREYDCITYQSYGKNGYHRFVHEISSVAAAKTIIIQHGINDIIHPVGTTINPFRPMTDLPTAQELIAGLQFYELSAFRLGMQVYFGTLLPIYGWRTYEAFREDLKNEVNTWLRKKNVIDFEKEIGRFKDDHYEFLDGCDSGDHLHPSKQAYQAMGMLAAKRMIDDL